MLTPQVIKSAPVGSTLWDGKIPGLHVRVYPKCSTFSLYYRMPGGRKRVVKLGKTSFMSIGQARDRAQELLLKVATGADPAGELSAERGAPTMADLCRRYLDDDKVKRKKSYHKDELLIGGVVKDGVLLRGVVLPVTKRRKKEIRIEGIILPKWGTRKVASIAYEDVVALRKEMAKTPVHFNRVLSLLSRMFTLAQRWGMVAEKPTRGVERYLECKRKRKMTADEAIAIAAQLDTEAEDNPASVAFIRLLVLTGARKGEIAAARWDWLDGNVIHLADSKTGARDVYLSEGALSVISSLPRTSGTLTGIVSPQKLWTKIRARAGCPDLHLHDLRRSFASVALSLGYSLDQIGELLGHTSAQTTKRYAYLLDEHKRAAANATALAITQRMGATA